MLFATSPFPTQLFRFAAMVLRLRQLKARPCFQIAAVIPLALLCACSADDGRVPVFPVQGRVLHQGEAAEGALVIFNPSGGNAESGIVPSGVVQSDGSFRLTSYETADGAPAGSYRVTVRWPEESKNPLEPPDMGEDRLGNRFIDPRRSPWQIEVVEGANELEPFQLD